MFIINNGDFLIIYFLLALAMWIIGLFGIIWNRANILVLLMSIELMLLSLNLIFIGLSIYLDDVMGQLVVLVILSVAAAEAAIGLAVLVVFERVKGNVLIGKMNILKG